VKNNKMMPFNGYFDAGCYLDGLRLGGDVVVLLPTTDAVTCFKESCAGIADTVVLSTTGFSDDETKTYLTTPSDFLFHYNLSILRQRTPKFVSDITFIAVDIDSYLVTEGLKGITIPIDGLITKEHNEATLNLARTTLNLLAIEAQKEDPFYAGYAYSKQMGSSFSDDFYDACLLTWGNLSPTNPSFINNPGYHQFLSIVMAFVEALHTSHPDSAYAFKGDRVEWLDGYKVKPFPLQQIIEARHGLPLSPIEPVSVSVSLNTVLNHAKGVLFKSTVPELYNSQMQKIYGITQKTCFETDLASDVEYKYFISESIMRSELISRLSVSPEDIQYVVYSGQRDYHQDEFEGLPVVFISQSQSEAEFAEISSYRKAKVVYWGVHDTDIAEASFLRKVSAFTAIESVEVHLDPMNLSLRSLPDEKVAGLLITSQDNCNFLLRKYSQSKLKAARASFQYDNRSKASELWQMNALTLNSLFVHYEKIRRDVEAFSRLGMEDVAKMFSGTEINAENLSQARGLIHLQVVSKLKVSSSYRAALGVISPINMSIGKNVWDPSDIMNNSLR